MNRVLAAMATCLLLVGCTEGPKPFDEAKYTFGGSPPVHRDDIVSVTLEPIPEGPTAPVFVDHPVSVEYVRQEFDLGKLRLATPDPLPPTLDQGHCEFGGNLVITTADDQTIAYGPCRRPESIDELWTSFIVITSGGKCEPSCAPPSSP
jgi:hypothetical protein